MGRCLPIYVSVFYADYQSIGAANQDEHQVRKLLGKQMKGSWSVIDATVNATFRHWPFSSKMPCKHRWIKTQMLHRWV